MPVFIAKNKETLSHCFLRIVDRDSARSMPGKEVVRLVNALTCAKSHKQLAAAIEGACLLFDTAGTPRQCGRVLPPAECAAILDQKFEPVDARKLAFEMFMASPRRLRANSGKESPAASLDAFAGGFKDLLAEASCESAVLVEPVQDWMTFRNFLTVNAALLANIEHAGQGGEVLEEAGFSPPEKSAFGPGTFVIPVKFQASTFSVEFMKHPLVSNGLSRADLDYLYWLFDTREESESLKDGVMPVVTHPFGGDRDVFFATHYEAKKENITPLDLARLPIEKDRNIYLCVRPREGENQLDMAKRVVLAFWRKVQKLADRDGTLLGISQDEESLFDPQRGQAGYICHSLVSRAWNELCFHKDYRLVACKYCGNAVLASRKGPVKEFCGDSCRIQYSEKGDG